MDRINLENSIIMSCIHNFTEKKIRDYNLLIAIETLNSSMFVNSFTKLIFEIIKEMWENKSEINFDAILNKLNNYEQNQLLEMIDVSTFADITQHCKCLKEYQIKNQINQNLLEAIKSESLEDKILITSKCNELYKKQSGSYCSVRDNLSNFYEQISQLKYKPISTGFKSLDLALGGGLYPGLCFLGAVSTLGKTTFTIQLSDNIAKSGNHVLFVSLEMSQNDLIARRVSRETYEIDSKNAKTFQSIINMNLNDKQLIMKAINNVSNYAHNLFIVEGMGDVGVTQIRDIIRKHEIITGKLPVIIIDYLQLLTPMNQKFSDKQNMDVTVMELKRISRDFNIPVIAISSLNRGSYKGDIGMSAFKESGSIEYSCDVLMGLQYQGMKEDGKDFDFTEAMKKHPRDIELKILKNRNGETGSIINYSYYSQYSYFQEQETKKSINFKTV